VAFFALPVLWLAAVATQNHESYCALASNGMGSLPNGESWVRSAILPLSLSQPRYFFGNGFAKWCRTAVAAIRKFHLKIEPSALPYDHNHSFSTLCRRGFSGESCAG
jgi:hypothetical protein